jgi:hypothetical protein
MVETIRRWAQEHRSPKSTSRDNNTVHAARVVPEFPTIQRNHDDDVTSACVRCLLFRQNFNDDISDSDRAGCGHVMRLRGRPKVAYQQ